MYLSTSGLHDNVYKYDPQLFSLLEGKPEAQFGRRTTMQPCPTWCRSRSPRRLRIPSSNWVWRRNMCRRISLIRHRSNNK